MDVKSAIVYLAILYGSKMVDSETDILIKQKMKSSMFNIRTILEIWATEFVQSEYFKGYHISEFFENKIEAYFGSFNLQLTEIKNGVTQTWVFHDRKSYSDFLEQHRNKFLNVF